MRQNRKNTKAMNTVPRLCEGRYVFLKAGSLQVRRTTSWCISWLELWYSPPSWLFYWVFQSTKWTRERVADPQVQRARTSLFSLIFNLSAEHIFSIKVVFHNQSQDFQLFPRLTQGWDLPLQIWTLFIVNTLSKQSFYQVLYCNLFYVFCYQGNNEDMDSLHYAALDVNQPYRSRKQRNNFTRECIYSSVRQ